MTDLPRVPLFLRVAGELVVIVAGVLIAFWVDASNQARQEAERVDDIVAGLLVDLRADREDLAARREAAERSLHGHDRLLELYRDPTGTEPADSMASWLLYTGFIDNLQILDHTYREVLGVGGLDLLPDDALRRSIAGYYRSMESADFFTDYYKKEEMDFWDLLEQSLHPDDFEAVARFQEAGELELRMDVARVLAVLRSSPEMANAIEVNRHWARLRHEVNGRRIARNEALAARLQAHLGAATAAQVTGFARDSLVYGRVAENVDACTVDAACYLRLDFADTSVVALYGTGERPSPGCDIDVEVSDAAFRVQPGEVVGVVVSTCTSGERFLRRLVRAPDA